MYIMYVYYIYMYDYIYIYTIICAWFTNEAQAKLF